MCTGVHGASHCQHPLRLVQTQLLKRKDLKKLDGNIAFFVVTNEHLTSSTWSAAARSSGCRRHAAAVLSNDPYMRLSMVHCLHMEPRELSTAVFNVHTTVVSVT